MKPPRSVWVVSSFFDGHPYSVHGTEELAIGGLMRGCGIVRYVLPPKRRLANRRITSRDLERLDRKINDPATKAERAKFDAAMSRPATRRRKGAR